MICHSLSLRSVRPRASDTCAGVNRPCAAGRSCLFARTSSSADFKSYHLRQLH
jgi:hypothetical protein